MLKDSGTLLLFFLIWEDTHRHSVKDNFGGTILDIPGPFTFKTR